MAFFIEKMGQLLSLQVVLANGVFMVNSIEKTVLRASILAVKKNGTCRAVK